MRNLDPALVAKRGLRRGRIRSCGRPSAASRPRTPRCSTRLRRGGCRSSRTGSAARASTRWSRSARSGASKRATLRVRDRRRRHQAGRPGAARAARLHVEVPALGDGVQVPGRAEDAMLQRDRGQHRPHRRGDAVRGARADRRRRLDDLDGDAAQPRRHRPQGHPRRRAGDHREGRRRHSARGRSGRSRRAGRPRAVGDADDLPGVRQPAAASRKTRRCGAARTARARRSCGAASSTSPRAAR